MRVGGAAAAWPFAALAQRSSQKVWRIAHVYPGMLDNPPDHAMYDVFRGELRELGYIEGKRSALADLLGFIEGKYRRNRQMRNRMSRGSFGALHNLPIVLRCVRSHLGSRLKTGQHLTQSPTVEPSIAMDLRTRSPFLWSPERRIVGAPANT
jgi:hypothetical protein